MHAGEGNVKMQVDIGVMWQPPETQRGKEWILFQSI